MGLGTWRIKSDGTSNRSLSGTRNANYNSGSFCKHWGGRAFAQVELSVTRRSLREAQKERDVLKSHIQMLQKQAALRTKSS